MKQVSLVERSSLSRRFSYRRFHWEKKDTFLVPLVLSFQTLFQMKIQSVLSISFLFPHSQDVKSYTQVGIPRSRIFTVNYKVCCLLLLNVGKLYFFHSVLIFLQGHLKYEISSTFQSTYVSDLPCKRLYYYGISNWCPSTAT